MLRTAASRLVAPVLRAPRPFSTTSPALLKIRHPSGPSTSPSSTPPAPASSSSNSDSAAPSSPSPSERPPPVPESIGTPPPPFEPEVSQPFTASRQTTSSGPVSSASTSTSTSTSSQQSFDGGSVPTGSEAQSSGAGAPLEPPSPASAGTSAETASSAPFDRSKLPSLDIDPEAAIAEPEPIKEGETGEKDGAGAGAGAAGGAGRKGRTGAGRKEYVSSIERQRRMWARLGLGALAVGGLGAVWYVGQKDDGQSGASGGIPSRAGLADHLVFFQYFNKPAFKVLLPDPLPPPHQRPYTLVVDLDGLLVHSSWDRQYGWRTAKRPGVDYFLAYLSQFYEIVLFTSQPLYTAAPVAEKLDPFGAYLPYKLFRESTRYHQGKVVKDLSYLNRDLSKVVLLDTNAEHAALQPENAIIIKPWEGQSGDKGLVDMIPFLESIGIYSPADIRPILKNYQGKDIPIEYAKAEAEMKRNVQEEWERQHPATSAGAGWLSGMFGSVAAPGSQRPNQPLTYLEQKRALAQRAYQEEQKYWRDNAEEFKKMIEEDKQRQIAEMKGSILGFVTGGKKPETEAEKK
ncbi:Mitochondrial import inner membrane translocase subunit TIM50 [Saitozyma sp. JCM 24511]|nr:Mitochondrial import inner membrane translocase subunit TIM50 [Saitozyma sp. JCM 24511]